MLGTIPTYSYAHIHTILMQISCVFHLQISFLGTVCATEMANRFCPTSGESGSLLMVKRSGYPSGSGFVAEGILSFIKGCDELTFGAANVTTNM